MTRREKESLLCSLYEAAYCYGLEAAREKKGVQSFVDEPEAKWKDVYRRMMAALDNAIMRIYNDTGRGTSLDAGDMFSAIEKLKSVGEKDGRAVSPSQRTRADIIRIIREMDIDDDEMEGDNA